MLASWPILLMHDSVGIGLLSLMLEIRQQWKDEWSFDPVGRESWPGSKRGRRQVVKPTWQYCDDPDCRYYGWPGSRNLRAKGYPNGGRWRQWHCQACRRRGALRKESRRTREGRSPDRPKMQGIGAGGQG